MKQSHINDQTNSESKGYEVDVDDILEHVVCKMFSRKLLELEGIYQSLRKLGD